MTRDSWSADALTRREVLRRAGALGLAGTAFPLLAACGGDDDVATTTAPAGGSDTAAAGTTEAGSTDAGSTTAAAVAATISMLSWDIATPDAGLGKGFTAAAKAWADANPGSKVTFDPVPFADFVAAATTRARAGKLSDVLTMLPGANHAPVFPALQPLTQAEFGALGEELTGWTAGAIDPAAPEQVAGVPIGGQGVVWYYNKALFEQAGLNPDEPPATWAAFAEACDALKAKGIAPIGMSGADSFLPWWAWSAWSAQFFPTSDDVLALRTGDVKIDDERVFKSLDAVAETHRRGWWGAGFEGDKFSDTEAKFATGKVAMVPGVIASIMNWVVWDEKLGKDAYGVFSAPLLEGASEQVQFYNPTLIYGVNKDSEEPEAARSFISYMASQEGQTGLLRDAGQFPNRSDVDIAGTTKSEGAAAIGEIIANIPVNDVIQNQFTAQVQGTALQKLTSAIVGDDVKGFLSDLAQQQAQG